MKANTKTVISLLMTVILVFLITTPVTSTAENTYFNNYNGSTGKPTSKNSVLFDFEYVTGSKNTDKDNYIPSFTLPSYDKIQLKNNNETILSVAKNLHSQKTPLFMHSNTAFSGGIVAAEIVSSEDGEPVRFGNKSLKISFDFSAYDTDTSGVIFLRSTAPTFSFQGNPVAIGCWVYIPENTAVYNLDLCCAGKTDGNAVSSYQTVTSAEALGASSDGTNWCGWKYLEFDLTKESDFQTSFNTGINYVPYGISQSCGIFGISYNTAEMSESKSDTIYIDDINLIYDYGNTDTEKPKIDYIGTESEQIVDRKTIYTSATNTFIAKYSDFTDSFMTDIDYTSVKMYIDGIDVTEKCYIDTRNDKISLQNYPLVDGLHSIGIKVSDMTGNKTTQMRYFTINTIPIPEATTKPTVTTTGKVTVVTTTAKEMTTAAVEGNTTTAVTESSTSSQAIIPMASVPASPVTSVHDSTTLTEKTTSTSVENTFIAGDINGDNKITASDARFALRIAAKLDIITDISVLTAADITNDGRITASDARIILRKAARLE